MTARNSTSFEDTLSLLSAQADQADANPGWPAISWQCLTDASVLSWCVPREYGGQDLAPTDLLRGYERLATACLTTTFILSQREAAVRRLKVHGSAAQLARFMPKLAQGGPPWTVGLSQLTTSRQHRSPALTAVEITPRHYRLDGTMPWVTAADQVEYIVAGGTLADGRQVLALVDPRQPGVTVEPPLALAALTGSRTTQVRCDGVMISEEMVLGEPAEQVLMRGSGGVGGLETSCLALGLAGAAVGYLAQEAGIRPEWTEAADRCSAAHRQLRARLLRSSTGADTAALIGIRVDCTQLALQTSQIAVAVAKGAGFAAPHPAQRWARQALFFLVWSCPRPAAEGLIARLLPTGFEGGR
jgi:alkylation response protein AidB-like acyl-CoA dehydrogenase